MKRRDFIWKSSLLTTGYTLMKAAPVWAGQNPLDDKAGLPATDLYRIFKDPADKHRPYVRWWWNGDKVEKAELSRELRLMKEAGIGGVEINPIKFPARTFDMNKPAIQWLSKEWIDILDYTLKEAASIGIVCDLIVGSGWPFGAEWLEGEERSQIVTIGTHKLEGPLDYEVSVFDLFKEADPAPTSPFAGRRMELMQVQLMPQLCKDVSEIKDLTSQAVNGHNIRVQVPEGKWVLYALVKVHGSMEVINGAPGANGPVLNHYNEAAVKKYLYRMSDTIQKQIGPLTGRVRSFFSDSMELEGANWCSDMADEFKKRRGYDLMPWLALTQFKTGAMGNIYDFNYGADFGPELKDHVERVRYDFDLTKSELIEERFIKTFNAWCKDNKVLSRMQAYGRGYFPLEGSLDVDLPECETWVKYGLGRDMPETDYRIGRAYTMVNKYVASAARLKGKRHISCEELTNTDMVFNDTLEVLKVAGDQSMISGVTHPVFHGFNYSPPDAPFPGWIRYGCYFNEKNTWWPYFRRFTDYKARFSALLQEVDMFADIAFLLPVSDMWHLFGAQNEPFPSLMYPTWVTLVWESMHQNGNACDYVSERILRDSKVKDGWLTYGPRKYRAIFLLSIERIEPSAIAKLQEFVAGGGRVFCIDTTPDRATGWTDHDRRNTEVKGFIARMKAFPDRFITVPRPESNFLGWYRDLQNKYALKPYVNIDNPDVFVTQVRYQAGATEMLLITNSHFEKPHTVTLSFDKGMTSGRQAWIWDAETGERYHIGNGDAPITLDLSAADSKLIVFDKEKKGKVWKPAPVSASTAAKQLAPGSWTAEFRHINGTNTTENFASLSDLKELPAYVHFSGVVTYKATVNVSESDKKGLEWLNLGKVAGVSEVTVNGRPAGTQWYGRRIFHIGSLLTSGANTIEVKVTTVMGNYMKTLKDNAVAQYWTNEKRKDQPLQSMGLIGPVNIY